MVIGRYWKITFFEIPGQEIITGRKRCSLAITEPSGGSDVANMASTAVREKDVYVPCHQVPRGNSTVKSLWLAVLEPPWTRVGGVCFIVGALSPLATF